LIGIKRSVRSTAQLASEPRGIVMAALRRIAFASAAIAATALAGCGSGANAGHAAVADGVKFDYALAGPASAAAPHTYRLSLKLAEATSGASIGDANVAVGVFDPGYDGSDLINLKRDGDGYAADVVMPSPAVYRMTFQVNRKPPAASAVAVFETKPPV
jgi:hypothetical protein